VSHELGARVSVVTASTCCNSGADAIGVALDWMRLGKCDLVHTGGTEAELVPGFLQAMTAARAQNDRPPRRGSPPPLWVRTSSGRFSYKWPVQKTEKNQATIFQGVAMSTYRVRCW